MKKRQALMYFLIFFIAAIFIKWMFSSPNEEYVALKKNAETSTEQTGAEGELEQAIPNNISYSFHVKPILSDKCFACHGPDEATMESGLRFDTKDGAYIALGENKDRYAVIPGDIANSEMIKRIYTEESLKVMPPKDSNLTLSNYEKEVLKKWIEQGAKWDSHWSFKVPEKPSIPRVVNQDWVKNEIDFFILKRIENEKLKPADRAKKERLIRRVSFDLTGLPPTIKDIEDFVKDKSSNAFEKVVDRLLASKAYGERMALDWMEVSRYADTHGYQDDLERTMWPWRDWVIHAFNENLPYNEFVKWQLAGDQIDNANLEQIVASGFNRNHKITQEGGVIDEEYRVEYVMDRTNTTAKAFMGLTMECARCHDHKYDPISQEEFYGMYSFFNQLNEKGQMDYGEIPEPYITLDKKTIDAKLSFMNIPDSIAEVKLMVMKDEKGIRKNKLLNRGLYDAPGEEVPYALPENVLPFSEEYSKDRLGLATWFFDDNNPLTARVMVNRLWQQMFGTGIVATADDFGNQGALPTHPELLDWLAVTFKEEGWDIKRMLKRMALSATYQQNSKITPELLEKDPENQLLARGVRYKLPAEAIRDNALAASGLLVEKVGGPSVKPYQPSGLWAETTSGVGLTEYIQDKGEGLYRRSLYTFWKRTVPPPSMLTFDAASRDFCTVQRQKTSTPLQALVLMNDPQFIEASEVMAIQVLKNNSSSEPKKIETLFQKITSRKPDESEVNKLSAYLNEQRIENAESEITKEFSESTRELPKGIDEKEYKAYTALVSLLFNLDETITKS
ncbi:PSD1 and planctomycete cytochrome C domain-containing protein [Aquimarina sp. D1M17]|uniref:PSD1 and planctomycete cytochrome C domain-containing protein n=1 Tax=Aquimarina acroporae TaxID=2937283 RepID=UPI0020BF1511|nr:PSD1 and planctomycete cytochrome C domain-containing protein [Aquimarina acroporae]MCK8520992.1 PSD1 and planctomycete cytochrome C domain-containing protein [Aquimarina acroporae]